jgi:hypothetical protein
MLPFSPPPSTLPHASSLEGSSQGPPSPMYENGVASEGFPVVDLSSKEEDATPNTLKDENIAHKLFGDLNHSLLGLPGDGNVIIFSDYEE